MRFTLDKAFVTVSSPARLALAALVAMGSGAAIAGCVEVQNFYRDVGLGDATADTPGGSGDAPIQVGADATRAVLGSIAEQVILPMLRDFETRAAALESRTNLAMTGGTAEREAARLSWREAMAVWQRAEMLQVGPAGLAGGTLGGAGLRDQIDGWPLVSRCSIDRNTVGPEHADTTLLAAAPINVRGLAAMEYLLFYEPGDNGCPAAAEINTSGSWAALGDAEVARRRVIYAHSLAVIVHARARELRDAWEPGAGNFAGALASAGAGSATYSSAQLGLNAVSDAFAYLAKEVLDYKLGIPAGLRMECAGESCPDRVESRWASASIDHLRANVEALRDAYLGAPPGTEGPGFDDLLQSIGAPALDERIQSQIELVLAALDAITVPLEVAVVSAHAEVVALYDAVRALWNTFSVEVSTCLDLQPPMRLEGDND